MAITINIYYTGKNGSAKEFAKEMTETEVVSAIRNEPGNLKYEYYFSYENPETVLLIDRWVNQKALDIHHHSPMMNKITELRNKYDLTMVVDRFVDDNNAPTTDNKYIRK